jgi:hypothetical protein
MGQMSGISDYDDQIVLMMGQMSGISDYDDQIVLMMGKNASLWRLAGCLEIPQVPPELTVPARPQASILWCQVLD